MSSFASPLDERGGTTLSEGGGAFTLTGFDLRWVENPALTYAAVVFSIICCFVSFSDLREHLSRFDYPQIQVLEMRIILMIPIYSVFSSLSLLFGEWRFFFITVRDTYESIVLYIFFMLMIAYCGGEGQLLRSLKKKRYLGSHTMPICWLPYFPLDTDFYLRCKRWVLQCALIKPCTSFIAMVTNPFGIYKEGTFTLTNVYTYNCIIINFSLTYALYYLVLFEVELEKELHYAKTFLKFLCVKSIIFFSYWQSICISLAASAGLLYMGSDHEEQELVSGLIQDLLMCFELLPVAYLHRAAFGRDKLDEEMACVPVYMKSANATTDLRSNVDTALNVNDIIDDTFGTIFYRRGKLMDQENADEQEGGLEDVYADVPAAPLQDDGRGDDRHRDPTVDELVEHAVTTDVGTRVDGLLHYDEDSDRDERNRDMNYTDTDVILHRSKHEKVSEAVKVDTDLLRSKQAGAAALGGPQIYCVVCGRFDREMVRRKNGYKCKECVGTKSQSLLRHRQRETMAPTIVNMDPASPSGGGGGEDASAGASRSHARRADAAAVDAEDEDEDHYIRAIPAEESEGRGSGGVAAGAAALMENVNANFTEAASAIADRFSDFNSLIRTRLGVPGGDSNAAAQRPADAAY